MTRACLATFLILGLLVMGHSGHAAEKKKEAINLYEVPTSGKIVDVQYRPEFDEWWVKCREGDAIAIYSYDKRGNRWGKIVFLPKKSEDHSKPGTAGDTGSPSQGGKPASERQAPKKPESKSDKTKWWDPLNIIKGGERLILPPPPSDKK